jgi:hypothetical protein
MLTAALLLLLTMLRKRVWKFVGRLNDLQFRLRIARWYLVSIICLVVGWGAIGIWAGSGCPEPIPTGTVFVLCNELKAKAFIMATKIICIGLLISWLALFLLAVLYWFKRISAVPKRE